MELGREFQWCLASKADNNTERLFVLYDANGVFLPDHMDDKQGSPILREPDGGLSRLAVVARVSCRT